ncbi:hypothetical protein BDZ89DRAFT_1061357 [Hymenopellis radicata]|nr:hypothetical protein BDZ89DRAFT_1061357 [Hymenopellis radicata]
MYAAQRIALVSHGAPEPVHTDFSLYEVCTTNAIYFFRLFQPFWLKASSVHSVFPHTIYSS